MNEPPKPPQSREPIEVRIVHVNFHVVAGAALLVWFIWAPLTAALVWMLLAGKG
jgi:hypothetical protein